MFNKLKKLTLLLVTLLTFIPAFAGNWTNYPSITTPQSTDTILIASPVNNQMEQWPINNLLNYLNSTLNTTIVSNNIFSMLFTNVYFVSPSGNDANDGINQPWATGNHYVAPGKGLYLMAGAWGTSGIQVFTNIGITYVLDNNAYAQFWLPNSTNAPVTIIGGNPSFADNVNGAVAFSNTVVTCYNCFSWTCDPMVFVTNTPYLAGMCYGNNSVTNINTMGQATWSPSGQNATNNFVIEGKPVQTITNTEWINAASFGSGVQYDQITSSGGVMNFNPVAFVAHRVYGKLTADFCFMYFDQTYGKINNFGSSRSLFYYDVGMTFNSTNCFPTFNRGTNGVILLRNPTFDMINFAVINQNNLIQNSGSFTAGGVFFPNNSAVDSVMPMVLNQFYSNTVAGSLLVECQVALTSDASHQAKVGFYVLPIASGTTFRVTNSTPTTFLGTLPMDFTVNVPLNCYYFVTNLDDSGIVTPSVVASTHTSHH